MKTLDKFITRKFSNPGKSNVISTNFMTVSSHHVASSVGIDILKNGGKFSPVRGIAHKHRMRPNSYWHTCGQKAQESADHYHQLARELN